jgi:ATP-dependent DNA helicase PIF1
MFCGGDELPGYAIQDGRPLECRRCKKVYEDRDKWAFKSDTWKTCKFEYFELRQIHRQSDRRFIDILQRCRYGQPLLPADKSLLLAPKPDPVGAVRLLPRRDEVNVINNRNFVGLQSAPRSYSCVDSFMWRNKNEPELQKKGDPKYPDQPNGPLKALSDHRFEERVQLKVGMLVILLVNLDFTTGLVNGSQGKIVGFEKHDEHKVFPTQEKQDASLGGRRNKDGPPSEYAMIKEGQVRHFIAQNKVTEWPVVQFEKVTQPVFAHCQMGEFGSEKPYSLLCRTQMPLLAAWAITIHKSQGMTLNKVIVDLHSSFEKEMVYVALSRARSLEGLKVERLARSVDQGVNLEVQAFLRENGIGGCR